MSTIPLNPGEAVTVMAHPCPTFAGSYRVHETKTGWLLALGHDPFNATAQRLAEEGVDRDTLLNIQFVDGRPTITGAIKDGLENAQSKGKSKA